MKTIERAQKLLADLTVINLNVHTLHWNIIGEGFEEYHEITDALYNDVFVKFDDIAEVLKAQDVLPNIAIQEMLKVTGVKEVEIRKYQTEEVIVEVKAIYEYLINEFKEIRKQANEEDNFTFANIMEDYISEYAKTLWMFNARTS